MNYSFDRYICREDHDCVKYDRREAVFGTKEIIPMWIADMDFETPPFIISALKERAEYPIFGYSFRGNRYYDAIISWQKRGNNWAVDPSWIGFSPGVVTGVAFALRALTKENDGVLIQTPIYPPFHSTIINNNRSRIYNELKFINGRFEIDFEDFEKKIKEVKAFILCNPHNPTGRVFSFEELKRMGDICAKHNVYIISDEIHADITHYGNKHTNIASISDKIADITVTISAANKTFNTGSLITSYTIAKNEEIRKKIATEMQRSNVDRSNDFGVEALIAAYTHGSLWAEDLNKYIAKNIDYATEFIRANMPKIKVYKPEATFLLWIDFRELSLTQDELKEFLVKEARLGLGNGIEYGESGAGFMRMNIGTRFELVEKALQQLLSAYKRQF